MALNFQGNIVRFQFRTLQNKLKKISKFLTNHLFLNKLSYLDYEKVLCIYEIVTDISEETEIMKSANKIPTVGKSMRLLDLALSQLLFVFLLLYVFDMMMRRYVKLLKAHAQVDAVDAGKEQMTKTPNLTDCDFA